MSQRVIYSDIRTRIEQLPSGRRIVAIAGAPGAGKSTVAERLAEDLNSSAEGRAEVFPMDGYHYDDMILEPRGWRPRKGAPHTFDVDGFAHTLRRLKTNAEDAVAVPVFDREIEIARAGGRLIGRDVDIILAEGNYLLLDEAPWDQLRALFDLTIFVEVAETELERRLEARWRHFGFEGAALRSKLEENDLPNGRLVLARGARADLVLNGNRDD